MLGRTDRRLRLVALLVVFGVAATLLGSRLAYWQVVRAGDLRSMAMAQLERTDREPPIRGTILDRSGTVVLAATGYRDLLAAYPDRIPEASLEPMVRKLGRILGLDRDARDRLRLTLGGDSAYVVIDRELSEEQSQRVKTGLATGTLTGLVLEPKAVRDHPSPGGAPDSTLASHLLGFVNAEGAGQYGIEQRYHDLLGGTPRITSSLRDASGRVIGDSTRVLQEGHPGTDLRLTVDASLQLQLEKELYAAWISDGARSVSAVVLDPDDGAVLAWATVPGYDADQYRRVATAGSERFLDPVVSTIYEPGSVMKMFVAAAGYSSGRLKPGTRINDTGSMKFGKDRVDDSDKRAMGWMSFRDVIAYSRNVGAARAALRLGKNVPKASAALYKTWRDLGVGSRTEVDVAGEVPGIATDPAAQPWPPIDLANRSFGQGMAVTPLQLAVSFSAMVNGGSRVQPHVVAAIGGKAVTPSPPQPVLEPKVSARLRELMTHVVTEVPWYAEGTLIPGYVVGGKTGTAQIWDGKRQRWLPNIFNFSFVGFVGQDRPEAVIAVQIHHARPIIHGQGDFELAITSYELFRRIAVDATQTLEIPRVEPAQSPDAADW